MTLIGAGLGSRLRLLGLLLLSMPSGGVWSSGQTAPPPTANSTNQVQFVALVYRDTNACPKCSEAVAALLRSGKWNFAVRYVGPQEALKLSAETLKTATLYAQPGDNGDVDEVFRDLSRQLGDPTILADWVRGGGRYLGICMGAYLAGTAPGFKLLSKDTRQFITSPKASVKTTADAVVRVYWRNRPRYLFFQDGPYFRLGTESNATVLAKYTNGKIAALVTSCGKGEVGLSGPHPEATEDWFRDCHLVNPDGVQTDLGLDLIDTLMQ